MKIIHTSDWHIGKKFENIPLAQEFDYFIDWLIQTIEQESIDLLIVAGDIFDTSLPSIAAQKQYYSTIAKLASTSLERIIIINGNHDSANFLTAPKQILSNLQTFISAGLPEDIEEIILKFPEKEPQVIIAAVPYLRDIDIINFFPEIEKSSYLQKNIGLFYNAIAEKTKIFRDAGIPIIATGHLFVSDSSQNQQDIKDYTLGGLIDITSASLPEEIDYYAFGHVHRPWSLKEKNIHYSGNPFPMGLNDLRSSIPKSINIIDTEDIRNIKKIQTPLARQLVKFEGSVDQVEEQIKNFENKGIISPAYAIAVIFIDNDNESMEKIQAHLENLNSEQVKILSIIFPPKQMDESLNKLQINSLNTNNPKDIFTYYLEQNNFFDTEKAQLLNTFDELLEIYHQKTEL